MNITILLICTYQAHLKPISNLTISLNLPYSQELHKSGDTYGHTMLKELYMLTIINLLHLQLHNTNLQKMLSELSFQPI